MEKLTEKKKNDDIFHISDQIKVLRVAVLNRALTSLHGGSFKITKSFQKFQSWDDCHLVLVLRTNFVFSTTQTTFSELDVLQ